MLYSLLTVHVGFLCKLSFVSLILNSSYRIQCACVENVSGMKKGIKIVNICRKAPKHTDIDNLSSIQNLYTDTYLKLSIHQLGDN